MLSCAVIYLLGDKLQLGIYAGCQAGARAISGVQASPASASEACTPQLCIALNTLGASSQAPETLIRPRKLFTTENTKDTKKMILLIQDIKNFAHSATAAASPKAPTVGALGNCSMHCSTSPIRGVVPPASLQSFVSFVVNALIFFKHEYFHSLRSLGIGDFRAFCGQPDSLNRL